MKKFILLISMMLCVNQIKSWSFTEAALGVVRSAKTVRSFAGFISYKYPKATVAVFGGYMVWNFISLFCSACDLEEAATAGRMKESQLQDLREVDRFESGIHRFSYRGQSMAYSEGKLYKRTSSLKGENVDKTKQLDESVLNPYLCYRDMASSVAQIALCSYGIYKTVFC